MRLQPVPPGFVLEAFLASTAAVTLAEMGDKTQLLTLFLAARYRRPVPIAAGIIIATLLNHWLSALLGAWLAGWLSPAWLSLAVGLSFIAIGLWLLIPDRAEDTDSRWLRWGPLAASTVLFFLAEIGDKTQIATVILAARYDAMAMVVAGTTVGMLAANLPVLLAGGWLLARISLDWARRAACGLFLLLGLIALWPWWLAITGATAPS